MGVPITHARCLTMRPRVKMWRLLVHPMSIDSQGWNFCLTKCKSEFRIPAIEENVLFFSSSNYPKFSVDKDDLQRFTGWGFICNCSTGFFFNDTTCEGWMLETTEPNMFLFLDQHVPCGATACPCMMCRYQWVSRRDFWVSYAVYMSPPCAGYRLHLHTLCGQKKQSHNPYSN